VYVCLECTAYPQKTTRTLARMLLLLIFLVYFSEANHSRDAFSIAKLPKSKEQTNYQVFLVIQPLTI
jgi:hypothetical protein